MTRFLHILGLVACYSFHLGLEPSMNSKPPVVLIGIDIGRCHLPILTQTFPSFCPLFIPCVKVHEHLVLIHLNSPTKTCKEFPNALGYDMSVNLSWITHWRRRHSVVSRITAGESASVDLDKVNTWRSDNLAQIRGYFKPEDIFDAAETAFFWKALPNRTLKFKGR